MLDVKVICNIFHEMIFCMCILWGASCCFSVFQDRRCFQLYWTSSKLSVMQHSGTVLCFLVLLACCSFSPDKHHSCSEVIWPY